nr:protein NRT1/ PTR FAMILY 5.8 [Tanacetum cinerariifolium]
MAFDQRHRTLNKPCILIIVIAGVERFVFKGVASNLVVYLTDVMGMSSSSAVRTVNNWSGFTSMLPLLVAPLVDSYWNRHTTIIASSFLYLIGLLALTSTSLSKTNSSSSSRFYSYGHDHDRRIDVKSLEKITEAVKCSVSRIIHWRSDEKSSLVELELEDEPFCSKQDTKTECLTDQNSNNNIFTVVGMQEFFYSAVPEGMRTMGIALCTSVFGVGSFLSALLVYLVQYFTTSSDGKGNWFSDDVIEARLDKYYWFLAGMIALSLVVFVAVCKIQKRS